MKQWTTQRAESEPLFPVRPPHSSSRPGAALGVSYSPWYNLAGRDHGLGTGARVAADARLARAHAEDPEAPELDAVATRQSQLHAFEHRIHRNFSFCLCDAGFVYDFVNNVELDQSSLLFPTCQLAPACLRSAAVLAFYL